MRFTFRPSLSIHSRNPQLVQSKIEKILNDGPDNLHVISDFDMTMTKYWVGGKRNTSSHGVVHRWSGVSQNFKAKCDDIYQKYYPIEISTEMTIAEKTPHMVQWWREAHDAIIQECITEGDLTKMVHENPIEFRAGLKQTLSLCDSLSIPFLVFSAGLADLIEEIIRQQKLYLPSMHVISNRMIFDEESGRVVAFSEPIVHVFNKNEFTGLLAGMVNKEDPHLHASKESLDTPQLTAKDSKLHDKRLAEYKAMISNRRNVLLLGDSVGDIQMGQGVSHDQLLSVGFLNMYRQTDGGEWVDSEQHLGTPTPPAVIKKHVDAHLDTFDVVLSNDCSLETFINELLESIMSK